MQHIIRTVECDILTVG